MSLKPKNPQILSEPLPIKDELSGPWGRISADPQAVVALRLCQKTSSSTEETHSYPYRVLSSWHWRSGKEEELKIEAGSDLLTVKGRGLDRVVEALDRNTLEILREVPDDTSDVNEHSIRISAITVSEGARSSDR